jgi:hypothetical protein
MTQSVIPGLERIMVLLDEMAGWAIELVPLTANETQR